MPLTTAIVSSVLAELNEFAPTNPELTHAKRYLLGLLKKFDPQNDNNQLIKDIYTFCLMRKNHSTLLYTDPINRFVQILKASIDSASTVDPMVVNTIQKLRARLFLALEANKHSNEQSLLNTGTNWYENNTVLGLIKQIKENDLQHTYNQDELLITAAIAINHWDEVLNWLLNEHIFTNDVLIAALSKSLVELATSNPKTSDCYDGTIAALLRKLGKGNYERVNYFAIIDNNKIPLVFKPQDVFFQYGLPKVLRILIEHKVIVKQDTRPTYCFYDRNTAFRVIAAKKEFSDERKCRLFSELLTLKDAHLDEEVNIWIDLTGQPKSLALLIRNGLNIETMRYHCISDKLETSKEWKEVKKALIERKYSPVMLTVYEAEIEALKAKVAELTQASAVSAPAVMRLSVTVGTQTDADVQATHKASIH